MNYGYNSESKGWIESKKIHLAFELSKALKIGIGSNPQWENDGHSPYIETDGSYNGVRIRRITHLSEKEQKRLVKKADKIYNKVMEL